MYHQQSTAIPCWTWSIHYTVEKSQAELIFEIEQMDICKIISSSNDQGALWCYATSSTKNTHMKYHVVLVSK